MTELLITAANSTTAVGHDGRMTSASVRAGISRISMYEEYLDRGGNHIAVARIRGLHDEIGDLEVRMVSIAKRCLEDMLDEYFRVDALRPSKVTLLLGSAAEERPGPRYGKRCAGVLLGIIEKWANQSEVEIVSQGNASLHFAMARAKSVIEGDAGALCVIGGVDSLLRDSTLSWFEHDGRLKSDSYGRHQGVIAGEAVSFMIVEGRGRTGLTTGPVLARVVGLGLTEEPVPRVSNAPSPNSGLTQACLAALFSVGDKEIRSVFGDLNGENSRAGEWIMAEMRCFHDLDEKRKLWSPANCYGDIGAASGAVLTNVVAQGFVRGWLQSPVLIFCSDDHGPCGALVLAVDVPSDGKAAGGS